MEIGEWSDLDGLADNYADYSDNVVYEVVSVDVWLTPLSPQQTP